MTPKYSQNEYFSYIFLIFISLTTAWLLGNNSSLLRLWYSVVMTILLCARSYDFRQKKYHHFLSEFCYYINFITIWYLLKNYDIKKIYPYLHGPLLLFSIVSGDAFIPHDLPRTTTFALHIFGTLITRKIYSNSNYVLTMDDLTWDAFQFYFVKDF